MEKNLKGKEIAKGICQCENGVKPKTPNPKTLVNKGLLRLTIKSQESR